MNESKFLGNLYDEDIYLIKESIPSEEKQQEEVKIEIKGDNRKGIVVLIDYPQANFLPGNLDEFFQKIMSAVSLTYKDIALINLAQAAIDEIPLPHTKILTFGISKIPGLNLDLKRYEIIKENDIEILNADSLKDISENKELKGQLWNSIRQLFPN